MIIDLTPEQCRHLKPMQDELDEHFKNGKPGILFAQVKPDTGEMVVRLIENEKALKIQEIIGEQPVGKTS